MTQKEKASNLILALCLMAQPRLKGRVVVVLTDRHDGKLWRASKTGDLSGTVKLSWYAGLDRTDLRELATRAAAGALAVALRETNADGMQENESRSLRLFNRDYRVVGQEGDRLILEHADGEQLTMTVDQFNHLREVAA